jgi:hypothetical protein
MLILQSPETLAVEENIRKSASPSKKASKDVLSPNPFSPTPSTSSAMKSSDLQSPGPSASLTEMEETPEKRKNDPDTSESAAEGDIQMEYSYD